MSAIPGILQEIKSIESELKRLRGVTKGLKDRESELKQELSKYLEAENGGIRCGDTIIKFDDKKSRYRKKKQDKERDLQEILRSHGVSDASSVLKELNAASKGEEYTKQVIVIK